MQGKEWESLRQDIENITREFNISSADFKPLGIHDKWDEIEGRIYQVFCRIDHPTKRPIWLWEYFKLDTSSLVIEYPFSQLKELVDPEEEVWFFVNGDKDKFWFYQGKIIAIMKVILESSYIDELYLASKKYDWLICINHHDVLIATGQTMAERLRHISTENAE
jgi:hypothetical protein